MTPRHVGPELTAPRSDDDVGTVVEGSAAVESDIAIGARLGRYVVVDTLGEGAMGRVVRAYDPKLGREVALKLLRTSDAEARARIVREAQAMAQLSHPHIVAVFDVDVHAGVPFIAMEYVVGTTLAAWLVASARTWRDVVTAFVAAGRGLAAAHRAGIVHRDFKPLNVLVGAGDDIAARVRVMDFGLARAVLEPPRGGEATGRASVISSENLTSAGMVMGTPAYMAPEQHAGHATDARCDQYAFCVALWEGLAGVRPFAVANLVADKWKVNVTEPASARPIPSHLRRVLLRGLAPQPEDRFADMDALLAAVSRDPSRQRVAFASVGVAVLGVAAVLGTRWWMREQARAACVEEGESIAEIWNPTVAASMRAGFVETGAPAADDSAARTIPWLDEYAHRWRVARTDVCLAAKVDGGDESLFDRARECLDERRASLRAQVTSLGAADAMTVRRAVFSSIALPPLAPCSDAARLNERSLVPDDDARVAVAQLRQSNSEVVALAVLGRLEEAGVQAAANLERAQELGFAPVLAQAELAVANVMTRRGDVVGARPKLEHAYFVAMTAGADDVAAMVALHLVSVVGLNLAEADMGLMWGRLGLASLERIGVTDDLRVAGVLHNLGNVLSAKGASAQAVDHHQRALAIRERVLGPEHPDLAGSYMNLGLVQRVLGNADEARALLERAIEIEERAYGPDFDGIAIALNTLSHLESDRGDFREALVLLERALAIQERALGPTHPGVAALLNSMGNVFLEVQRYDEATAAYTRELAIEEAHFGPEHAQVSYAINGLGVVARLQGRIDESLAYHRRALAIEQKALGADHIEVADTLENLAQSQLEAGDRSGAVASLERALAIETAAASPPLEVARVRFALALALFEVDQARALAIAEEAKRAYAASDRKDEPAARAVAAQADAWSRLNK